MATGTCRLPVQVMVGRYCRRDGRASVRRTVDGRVARLDTISVRFVGVARLQSQRGGRRLVQVSVLFRRPALHRHVLCSPPTLLNTPREQVT